MTNPTPMKGTTLPGYNASHSAEQAHRVLRNTYGLLALSLAVSAGAAWFAMATGVGFINPILLIAVYIGLLFANAKLENSSWGVLTVFAITGWLGFSTGPIISAYVSAGGGELVTLALGMTALIFVAMTAIGLTIKRDLSNLGKFLFAGILVAFVGVIVSLFTNIPALQIALSGMFAVLSSLLIMWQTNMIVSGGETNYIRATVTLFVSLYNLFLSLLHLLSAFNE